MIFRLTVVSLFIIFLIIGVKRRDKSVIALSTSMILMNISVLLQMNGINWFFLNYIILLSSITSISLVIIFLYNKILKK